MKISDLALKIISIALFSTHIMVYFAYQSKIVPYDINFLISIISIGAVFWELKIKRTEESIKVSPNSFQLVGILFLLLIGVQCILIEHARWTDFLNCCVFFLLFLGFCSLKNQISTLAFCFSFALLVGCSFQLFEYYINGKQNIIKGFIVSGLNSNYLASAFPFSISILLSSKINKEFGSTPQGYLAAISSILCIWLLIISHSRTALVASIVSTLFLINITHFPILKSLANLLSSNRRFFYILLGLAGVASFYMVYSINKESVLGRLLIYDVSYRMFETKPFLGIGFKMFKNLYNNYQANFFNTHAISMKYQLLANDNFFCFNEFIKISVELGIFGLILIIIVIALIFQSFINQKKNKNTLLVGAFSSIGCIIICSIASYPLEISSVLINALFFISIISYSNSHKPMKVKSISFKINKIELLLAQIGMIILFVSNYSNALNYIRWEKASKLAELGSYSTARPIYESLYPKLKSDGNFLFNYGAETFLNGRYKESLIILEAAEKQVTHTNLYIYLGNNYSSLGRSQDADRCYIHASSIAPVKFLPKYLLFLSYKKQGRISDALVLAKHIQSFPVKISSSDVVFIKTQASEFIENYKK